MPTSSHCRAGVPLPTLRWYKDAISISTLQNPRYKVLPSGVLRIQKLRPDDSGIFQCFASNEGGEVQTHTFLDVTSEYRPADSGPSGPALQTGFPTWPAWHTQDVLSLLRSIGCRALRGPLGTATPQHALTHSLSSVTPTAAS